MPSLTLKELWNRIDPLIDSIDSAQSDVDLQEAITAARGAITDMQAEYFLAEAFVAHDLTERAINTALERIGCQEQ